MNLVSVKLLYITFYEDFLRWLKKSLSSIWKYINDSKIRVVEQNLWVNVKLFVLFYMKVTFKGTLQIHIYPYLLIVFA